MKPVLGGFSRGRAPCALGALGLLLIGAGAPGEIASAAGWEPIPPAAWREPARPDSGGRDAVILLDRGELWDREDRYRLEAFRRTLILSREGRSAASGEIFLFPGDKLESLEGRCVRPDGRATDLPQGSWQTTSVTKWARDEVSRISFDVPGAEPGNIVEYRYALSGRMRHGVSDWPLQRAHYVCESRFVLHPSGLWTDRHYVVHVVPVGIAESRLATECEPDCDRPRIMTFTARTLPSGAREEWAPHGEDAGPALRTHYRWRHDDALSHWDDLREALDLLYTHFARDPGSFQQVLDALPANPADPAPWLRSVHRWLQRNIKPEDEPAFGAPRPKPRNVRQLAKATAAEVVDRGSGNAFEINALFVLAAKRIGVDARLGAVGDRREAPFDHRVLDRPPTDVVTVIRMGPRDWRFCQPASRFSAFGTLPWYLRGGEALLAGQGRPGVVGVPAGPGNEGTSRWELDFALDAEGRASGEYRAVLTGEGARDLRRRLWAEDPARRAEVARDELGLPAGVTLEIPAAAVEAPPDSALRLSGRIAAADLGTPAGGHLMVDLAAAAPWRLQGRFPEGPRFNPISFRWARDEVVAVRLRLPKGALAAELPAERRFECDLGSWSQRWEGEAEGLRYERRVTIAHPELEPRAYSKAREYFEALRRADEELVMVSIP